MIKSIKDEKQLGLITLLSNSIIHEEKTSPYIVPPNSEDWRFVEFHLKASVSTDVEIKRIVNVKNTNFHNSFEEMAKKNLSTYAWYNLKGTPNEVGVIQKIRSKCFEMPETGADFRVGSIFDENKGESEIESVFLLCKIIIGRSFCKIRRDISESSTYGKERTVKPSKYGQYESIMYCPADSIINRSTKMGWGVMKSYEYHITEPRQVDPLFCVYFSQVDSSIANLNYKLMCGECEMKESDCYCLNCEEYLCKECQLAIHGDSLNDANAKKLFNHNIEDVKYKLKTGKCNLHRDNDVEYYCQTCKRAICSYCKVIGDHSKGDSSLHILEDIRTYISKYDPKLGDIEEKKKKAVEFLQKAKEQIEQLRNLQTRAHNEIRESFEDENNQIMGKAADCEMFHYSIISDLKVIKSTLLWLDRYFTDREAFLKDQNKAEYVWLAHHHEKLINEVMENKKFINTESQFQKSTFDMIKMNDVIVHKYKFEEFKGKAKEQKGEDNIKKKGDYQKTGVFDLSHKSTNYFIMGLTKKILTWKQKEELAKEQAKESQIEEQQPEIKPVVEQVSSDIPHKRKKDRKKDDLAKLNENQS